MKGVFLDLASLDNEDLNLEPLHVALDEWDFYPSTETAEVAARLQGAEVVVSNKVVLSREALASTDTLRLICVAATGTNNVDLDAARERGIIVTNVRAYGTASVVQHVFTLMLSLQRRIPAYQQAIRQGRWEQSRFFCLLDYPIEELGGKVLGIIGYGQRLPPVLTWRYEWPGVMWMIRVPIVSPWMICWPKPMCLVCIVP